MQQVFDDISKNLDDPLKRQEAKCVNDGHNVRSKSADTKKPLSSPVPHTKLQIVCETNSVRMARARTSLIAPTSGSKKKSKSRTSSTSLPANKPETCALIESVPTAEAKPNFHVNPSVHVIKHGDVAVLPFSEQASQHANFYLQPPQQKQQLQETCQCLPDFHFETISCDTFYQQEDQQNHHHHNHACHPNHIGNHFSCSSFQQSTPSNHYCPRNCASVDGSGYQSWDSTSVNGEYSNMHTRP